MTFLDSGGSNTARRNIVIFTTSIIVAQHDILNENLLSENFVEALKSFGVLFWFFFNYFSLI